MKIAHASDIHGDVSVLAKVDEPVDLWVLTGDIFPNVTRGNRRIEEVAQVRWYAEMSRWFAHTFGKTPVLLVPGNHDYADLANLLRRDGVNAREVTPEGLTFKGVRFAGFGQIPIIAGEWNRETTMSQLAILTRRTLELGNPEVLVTHAPPDGILNGLYRGIGPLTSYLSYRPHRVRLHLFGHAHEDGGREETIMGIRFVNSALTATVIDI